jgi:hypothetical protein
MVGDSQIRSLNQRLVERATGGLLLCPGSRRSNARAGLAYTSAPGWPEARYDNSNLAQVLPRVLEGGGYSHLLLLAPTSDVTNLAKLPKEKQFAMARQSACNVVAAVEAGLRGHDSLQSVLVMERLPRQDGLAQLSDYSNMVLREEVARSPLAAHISVGGHPGLRCTTPDQVEVLFGAPGARGTDGLHLRGSRGQHLHTSAVIAAIKACGLGGQGPAREGRRSQPSGRRAAAGWQVVGGGRRASRPVAGQEAAQPALPTANSFAPLGN